MMSVIITEALLVNDAAAAAMVVWSGCFFIVSRSECHVVLLVMTDKRVAIGHRGTSKWDRRVEDGRMGYSWNE